MAEQVNYRLSSNPIPNDFYVALTPLFGMDTKCRDLTPFTQEWEDAWLSVAADDQEGLVCFGHVYDRPQRLFPGSADAFRGFKKRHGLYFLSALTEKGANPNFMVALLIKYLWNERIAPTEKEDFEIKRAEVRLRSIHHIQQAYWDYINPPDYSPFPPHSEGYSLMPSCPRDPDEFENILDQLEIALHGFLNSKDLRDPGKRRPPNEKANRTIFTIHEHLKLRTGSPHWELFWNLLVAAGTISGGGALSNKDRQLRPRIDSFERDHPNEAEYIRAGMIQKVLPFSHW